ncbi:MAG: hypothetical protein ABS876_02035 [Ruminococcus sp.]
MDNNYNNDGFTPNPQNNDAPSPYRQNNQTDYSAQFAQYNQSRNVTEGQPEPPAQPDYTTTYQSEQPDQPAQPDYSAYQPDQPVQPDYSAYQPDQPVQPDYGYQPQQPDYGQYQQQDQTGYAPYQPAQPDYSQYQQQDQTGYAPYQPQQTDYSQYRQQDQTGYAPYQPQQTSYSQYQQPDSGYPSYPNNTQQPYGSQQGGYYGGSYPVAPTDRPAGATQAFAIVSLVCGILSILLGCCGWGIIFAVPGTVFGIISRVKCKNNNGMALAGAILSIIGLVLSAVVIVLAIVGNSGILDRYNY